MSFNFNLYNTKVITTKEWGARRPKASPIRCRADKIILHHMATPNPPRHLSKNSTTYLARECQRWHMYGNGWNDTGQHFTIACDGTILEGRTGSLDALMDRECVKAGHCVGQNNQWGVEIEGTHSTVSVSKEQLNSIVNLCAMICFRCNIDSTRIFGHRYFNKTDCPGNSLYEMIPTIIYRVHNRILEIKGEGE